MSKTEKKPKKQGQGSKEPKVIPVRPAQPEKKDSNLRKNDPSVTKKG